MHHPIGLGEPCQAIDVDLDIAREIGDRHSEGKGLGILGLAYLYLGGYQQAIHFSQQSLDIAQEIGDRNSEGNAFGNLGFAYFSLGDYQQAITFSQQSLDIAQEIGNRRSEAYVLNNLGLTYLSSQQPALAETLLSEAITLLDALRSPDLSDADKVSIFDTQQRTFRLLQQALVAQGKVADALTIAERGRARAFVELLSQRVAAADAAVAAEPPSIEAIQALAQQQQTTLVEYSLIQFSDDDDPALYIWVISPDGTISFRQQSLTDIDLTTLVTDTRQSIGVRSADRASARPTLNPEYLAQRRADTDQNLTDLHDLLIDPIADLLPTDPNQPVVFIPQGELFLVPFPALKDPNGKYLIENHTLLTAPSIQVLQLTQDLADRFPASFRLSN